MARFTSGRHIVARLFRPSLVAGVLIVLAFLTLVVVERLISRRRSAVSLMII